jgi:hypothetical protein
MPQQLRLVSLRVQTAQTHRTYSFHRSLTVITGSVGTGKSSLLMLVKHALGGRAALTPAVRENVISVTLELIVGTQHVRLRRAVPDPLGQVEILDLTGLVEERLPTRARSGVREAHTISDRLLDWLEIPRERIVTNKRSRNAETVAITFRNLLLYLFLEARDIDRSIAGSADTITDRARKALFEILFGLTNERLLEAQRRENQLVTQARATKDRVQAVSTFLADVATPTIEQISEAQRTARTDLSETSAALEALHRDVSVGTQVDEAMRRDISRAVDDQRDLTSRTQGLEVTVRSRRSIVAQLELDLARHLEARTAQQTLQTFEFVSCPRCAQNLQGRPTPPGHCALCLQPDPPTTGAQAEAETARLKKRLDDYRATLDQDETSLAQQISLTRLAQAHLERLQRQLDEMTRQSVAPRLAKAEQLTERRAQLTARLERLGEARELWNSLEQLRTALSRTEAARKECGRLIKRIKQELAQADDRVDAASEAFRGEIRTIGIPGVPRPEIRKNDYLPYSNGVKFDQIQASGGGILTALHIAYSLSLIQVSLDDSNVLLPAFLIIDSPRKAIGQTVDDAALSLRIYKRLISLVGSERMQLIIADNDLPQDARTELEASRYAIVDLDYGLEAMIPGVNHPGFSNSLATVESVEDDDPNQNAL